MSVHLHQIRSGLSFECMLRHGAYYKYYETGHNAKWQRQATIAIDKWSFYVSLFQHDTQQVAVAMAWRGQAPKLTLHRNKIEQYSWETKCKPKRKASFFLSESLEEHSLCMCSGRKNSSLRKEWKKKFKNRDKKSVRVKEFVRCWLHGLVVQIWTYYSLPQHNKRKT